MPLTPNMPRRSPTARTSPVGAGRSPATARARAARRRCRCRSRPWPLEVALLGGTGRLVLVGLVVAHRSRPFISEVGRARSAAVSSSGDLGRAVGAELGVLDLVVQLEDRVDQHLRARRAAGEVHVDRDDVVDALDDRVVVEHAAGDGADAHREHPLGLGHLVVDLAQDRGHLLADPAGDDHQVGLARAGAEDLHAEAGRGRTSGRRSSSSRWRSRPGRRSPARTTPCACSRRRPRRSSAGRRSAASLQDPWSQSHSSPPRRHT